MNNLRASKIKFFIILAIISLMMPVFLSASDTVYVIRQIEFEIVGRTKPFALMSCGEFAYGERIVGEENLERYLAQKRQLLLNQLVLQDAKIEHTVGGSEEDGALPVTLFVYVEDTWNLVIFPQPKYDSNDGFSIILKARDYNFLGTMGAVKLDLGYDQKDNKQNVNFAIDSSIPFNAMGLNWNFIFNHSLGYTYNEPFYYQTLTGLSLELPYQLTKLTLGFNQYLTVNEKNTDEDKDIYGLGERFYGPYGSTELYANLKIPFGIEVGDYGEVSYTPGLSGRINYPYGGMDESRKPLVTLSHSIGFGRVDWNGNYRKGLQASISNSYGWYFDRVDAPLKISVEGNASVYRQFFKFLGLSARFNYRQWWHWSDMESHFIPYYNAGDFIRGVLNTDIRAHQIFTFNLDIPVRIFRFWPSDWFNNPKFRFYNFEMHLSPFTDMAFFKGPYSKIKNPENPHEGASNISFEDMINTAGFEVIVFPGFFRTLQIRASLGYDLNRIRNNGLSLRWGFFPKWNEIFIGLDLHY